MKFYALVFFTRTASKLGQIKHVTTDLWKASIALKKIVPCRQESCLSVGSKKLLKLCPHLNPIYPCDLYISLKVLASVFISDIFIAYSITFLPKALPRKKNPPIGLRLIINCQRQTLLMIVKVVNNQNTIIYAEPQPQLT